MSKRMKHRRLSPKREAFARTFQRFSTHSEASGIILVVCAVIAVVWNNSILSSGYYSLTRAVLTIVVNGFGLAEPFIFWVNDGLMAIFFLAVGLEIKREIVVGELSSVKKAVLPLAAALGGMIFPAIIYFAFNSRGDFSHGWGIPVATDIAFALGVLALLGNRIPIGLKVFLAALAIADDVGAVAVIALFYSHGLSAAFLMASCGVVLLLLLGNRMNIRSSWFYGILGVVLWCFVLKSGIHATVAGVALAMTIPARSRIPSTTFVSQARHVLGEIDADNIIAGQTQDAVQQLESLCDSVQTPLQQFEHALQPFVSYLILPVFALVNAGILLTGLDITAIFGSSVTLGIMSGLVFGKVVGVFSFVWLAIKLRIAELPSGVGMSNMFGVSWLCGIGFTMSLFIAGLAFGESWIMTNAKIGIFCASVAAGIIGYTLLRQQFTSKTGAIS